MTAHKAFLGVILSPLKRTVYFIIQTKCDSGVDRAKKDAFKRTENDPQEDCERH